MEWWFQNPKGGTLRVPPNATFLGAAAAITTITTFHTIFFEKQGWHWATLARTFLEKCRKTVRCIEFENLNNLTDFFFVMMRFDQLRSIRYRPREFIEMVPRSDLEIDWHHYPQLWCVEGLRIQPFLKPCGRGDAWLTDSSNPSLLALLCVNEQKLHCAVTLFLCFRARFGSKPLAKMVAQRILDYDPSLWYVALPSAEKMLNNPRLIPFSDAAYTEAIDKKVEKHNSVLDKVQEKKRFIKCKKDDIARMEKTIETRKRQIEGHEKTLKRHEESLKRIKEEIRQATVIRKMFE